MKNIEVELRSFISDKKYGQLLKLFNKEGKLVSKDNQITYSLNNKNNIRIQKNDFYSKLWIKLSEGNQHDAVHEEVEIRFSKNDFDKMEKAVTLMGFAPKIKWFRKRHTFKWRGINAMVDYTKGYGYILELEKLCNKGEEASALKTLNERIRDLNIKVTPKEEFDKRYAHYKENWRRLTESK
jgi:predicted adenylyl cyclase CyaB